MVRSGTGAVASEVRLRTRISYRITDVAPAYLREARERVEGALSSLRAANDRRSPGRRNRKPHIFQSLMNFSGNPGTCLPCQCVIARKRMANREARQI